MKNIVLFFVLVFSCNSFSTSGGCRRGFHEITVGEHVGLRVRIPRLVCGGAKTFYQRPQAKVKCEKKYQPISETCRIVAACNCELDGSTSRSIAAGSCK